MECGQVQVKVFREIFYSSAKSSFSGYFTSAYNAVRHPVNTAQTVANNVSKMSATELISAPITMSPGYKLMNTYKSAATAVINGNDKALGSIIGSETANTVTAVATRWCW